MYYAKINSKWGELTANIDSQGHLSGLWFQGQKYFPSIEKDAYWISLKAPADDIPPHILDTFNKLKKQLKQYEKGTLKDFDLPLSPLGTAFRQMVWQALLQVPYGQTSTYGEIGSLVANKLGKKSMSGQATGGAVGHNPISIIIPCHRIIAKNGALTGYAGGLDRKAALLQHEAEYCKK